MTMSVGWMDEREVVSSNGTQPHVNPKPVRRSDSQFVSTRPSNKTFKATFLLGYTTKELDLGGLCGGPTQS